MTLRLHDAPSACSFVPHVGRELAGEGPSFLDAYMLTVQRWGGYAGIDPVSMPSLGDYVARLAQHPNVAAVIARERIELNTSAPAAA
jgi:glutathione S-transferase